MSTRIEYQTAVGQAAAVALAIHFGMGWWTLAVWAVVVGVSPHPKGQG